MNYNKDRLSNNAVLDIKDLFFKMLRQWKAVLITMIAFALLCCGYKHYKDVKVYKAQQAAAETAVQEADIENISEESLLSSLSESEKALVVNYIQQFLWLRDEENYVRTSILMRTDPNNQRAVNLCYIITSNDEEYNKVDFSTLAAGYIHSTGFAEAIKDTIEPGAEDRYITELINTDAKSSINASTAYDKSSNEFTDPDSEYYTFRIIIPENADIAAVTEAATAAMQDFVDRNKSTLHISGIKLAESYETRFINASAVATKQNANSTIRDAYNTANSLKSSLNEKQLGVANAIIAQNTISTGGDAAEEALAEANTAEENKPEAVKPGYSKKYAVAGAFLGFLLYLIYFFLSLAKKGAVGSEYSAESIIGDARMIGTVITKDENPSPILSSKLVTKLINRNGAHEEEQLEHISYSVSAACKHQDMEQITMVSMDKKADEVCDCLKEKLAQKGINTSHIYLSTDSGLIDELALTEVTNGLLIIYEDDKQSLWKKAMDLSGHYGSSYIGGIYVAKA